MRPIYLIWLGLLLSGSLSAASYPGFLLTKDGYKLTGYLNVLSYAPTGNNITFTNDFGDQYTIHPFLVSGFGMNLGGAALRFVSRYHAGQWYFLQEDTPGRSIQLYRLPDGSDRWVDDRLLRLFTNPPPTYFINYRAGDEERILPVPRAGFRRNLREFFGQANPEFARKIGTKGYRYRDLSAIVEAFNQLKSRQRRRL